MPSPILPLSEADQVLTALPGNTYCRVVHLCSNVAKPLLLCVVLTALDAMVVSYSIDEPAGRKQDLVNRYGKLRKFKKLIIRI